MKFKVVYRPLTEMTNRWIRSQNPHMHSVEEVEEVTIDAANENQALQTFMTMIQHAGIKIAEYRIELVEQKSNDAFNQNRFVPFV